MNILPYIRKHRARRRFIFAYTLSVVLGTALAMDAFHAVTNVKAWILFLVYLRNWIEQVFRRGKKLPRLLARNRQP